MKITVTNDERIFTVMCLANSTTYNTEWGKHMHPIRKNIRKDLRHAIISDSLKELCTKKGDYWLKYYTNLLSQPPAFKVLPNPDPRITFIDAFAEDIRLFYKQNNIHKLYETYKLEIDNLNKPYKSQIKIAIDKVSKLVDIPICVQEIRFYMCPLISYHSGSNITPHNKPKEIYLIQGPQNEISFHTPVHEYLHSVVSLLVEAKKEYLNTKYKKYMKLVKADLLSDYPKIEHIIDESLVRAIEWIIVDEPDTNKRINKLVRDGYLFTRFFYDALKDKTTINEKDINSLLANIIL